MNGKALNVAARMTDPDWPGVVCLVSDDVRLAVNAAGTRYALQRRRVTDDGFEVWPGVSFATLCKLVAKHGPLIEGLAVACEGLPDDPAFVSPDLQESRSLLLAQFAATDWRREDYGRVASRDGNLRVVVDPDATVYRVQRVDRHEFLAGPCDNWRTIFISPYVETWRNWLFDMVFDTELGPKGFAVRDKSTVAALVDRLCDGLPPDVSDGLWPVLPPRPGTS